MSKKISFLFILFFCLSNQANAYSHKTDSLLNELKKPLEDTSRLKAFEKIFKLNELSTDSAILFVKQLMHFADNQPSDSIYTIAVQTSYGCYLNKISDREAAQKICWNLFERMQQRGYVFGMASACKYLGVIYLYHSLDSSMYYHLKCIELFKSINFERGVFATNINLGSIYMDMKKYKEAIDVTKAAYDYFEETGDLRRVAICNINLTQCYKETGQLDSAVKYAQAHIHKSNLLNNNQGLAHARSVLGEIYILKKEFDKAQKEFDWIIKKGIAKPEADILYTGYFGMGKLEFAKLNFNAAIENAELALKNVPPNNLQNEIFVYEFIYKCYKDKGDYKLALSYYDKYITTNDSFKNVDRLKKIDALEAKYQNKEKQTQIELLDAENKLQEAETDKHKNMRNTIALVFVLAVVTGVYAFSRYRVRVKQKQEAERARISRDLHDDVGATLGSISIYSEVAKNKSSSANGSDMNEVLEKIGDSSREMLEKMNDIVWAVNPKNDSAEELIHRMKNFAALMLTPRQIKFTFDSDAITANGLKLEMQQRKNIFLIYKEALHNIIKYADAKEVNVKLNVNGKNLIVEISDDGSGFNSESTLAYNGNGIKNMQARAGEIGGKFEIKSEINKGTTINVSVPV